MLTLNVKVGEAVQVGENPDAGVVLRVMERTGFSTRLSFATNLRVHILGEVPMPERFTSGVTGIRRPVRVLPDLREEPMPAYG